MMKFILCILIVMIPWVVWGADKALQKPCPKTTMINSCLECHIKGSFKVKETPPDAHLTYPTSKMRIAGWNTGEIYGYYLLTDIAHEEVNQFFEYLHKHNIKKAVIEIHSPGGALFDAQRIVNIILYWRSRGVYVETRLFGLAASAGFYILQAGDKRLVSPNADLLWHEIRTVEGWGLIRVVTPSDKEQEAKIFRHLQDVRNAWLSERSGLPKYKIDEMIKYKDWWMSGKQAVDYGFADGLIQ